MTYTPDFEFHFVDAPPPRTYAQGKPGKWATALERLKEHPGQWARIRRMKKQSAYAVKGAITKGRDKHIDPAEWEIVARPDPEDKRYGYVYARYVG